VTTRQPPSHIRGREGPHVIAFGRFAAELDAPNLRRITIAGHEFAQTITFSVRDQNWGTVEPSQIEATIETRKDSTHVHFTARYTSSEIDLDLVGKLDITNDSFTYTARAIALKDFLRCRIGICVLHPASFAGRPLYIETLDDEYGTLFPVEVSADRSVTDIVSMRHRVGDDKEALLEFTGELFEFEDQRNWTDASYKTFSTPLTLPLPVQVVAGQVIEQTLRVSTTDHPTTSAEPPMRERSEGARASIAIGTDGPTLPSIGVSSKTTPDALAAAKMAGLSHVRATIDVSRMGASEIDNAMETIATSALDIDLELVADSPTDLIRAHEGLSALSQVVRNVYVLNSETQITPQSFRPAIERLREVTGLRIGGGSGTNFGALNFNIDEIPLESLESLTFPMSPQVHYTDDFSVLVNVDAQGTVAENGLRIAAGRDLTIGPITLLPRRAGAELAQDRRSGSLLEAAWTVGSLSQLVGSGASTLTYHESTGLAGILGNGGTPTPTYHVLAGLAPFSGATVLPITVDMMTSRIAVFALQSEGETLVVIANLESSSVDVELDISPPAARIRMLDESTIALARQDRTAFVASATSWNGDDIHLAPFAIATLVAPS